MESIRLNKYLSDAGICSRRQADRWIEEKRITVNGEIAGMGMKVAPDSEVCLDGLTEAMQRIDATSKEIQKLIFEKYMETYTDAKPGMPFFLKMKGNTVIQILEKPMA